MRTNSIVRGALSAALCAASMSAIAQSTSPDARAGSVVVETQKPKPRASVATNPQPAIVFVDGRRGPRPPRMPVAPKPPAKTTVVTP